MTSGIFGMEWPYELNNPVNTLNRNTCIKMSSFKSSGNIEKKEGGSDRSVLNNKFSSVTLNELAIKGLIFSEAAKLG